MEGEAAKTIAKKCAGLIGDLKWHTTTVMNKKRVLRLRVEIEVMKPLCPGTQLKRRNREPLWLAFKYERMPFFCFRCGRIGHEVKSCNIPKGLNSLEGELGIWMRAEVDDIRGGYEKGRGGGRQVEKGEHGCQQQQQSSDGSSGDTGKWMEVSYTRAAHEEAQGDHGSKVVLEVENGNNEALRNMRGMGPELGNMRGMGPEETQREEAQGDHGSKVVLEVENGNNEALGNMRGMGPELGNMRGMGPEETEREESLAAFVKGLKEKSVGKTDGPESGPKQKIEVKNKLGREEFVKRNGKRRSNRNEEANIGVVYRKVGNDSSGVSFRSAVRKMAADDEGESSIKYARRGDDAIKVRSGRKDGANEEREMLSKETTTSQFRSVVAAGRSHRKP